MPTPTPQINDFLANMRSHSGPAKAERFYVLFTLPVGIQGILSSLTNDISFQCEASELPGTNMQTTQYRMYGPMRNLAIQPQYNNHTLTFYCSNDFYEKPFFDAWMEFINPRGLGWDFRYKDDYCGSINIIQMSQIDSSGYPGIYQSQLQHAFPVDVSALPLHWQDDSIHKLSVTFAYDKYLPQGTFQGIFDQVLGLGAGQSATGFSTGLAQQLSPSQQES